MHDHQSDFSSTIRDLCRAWELTPDGSLITTRSSWVLPVRRGHAALMLKVARIPDEQAGYRLMEWWRGEGAARVIASDHSALLMERAIGVRNLAEMARSGSDDEATRILCGTAARLHTSRAAPVTGLHALETWFQPLFEVSRHNNSLAMSAKVARLLLADPRDIVPLHGDLHHENVLDFGPRGWLAIDPHGLVGERMFDYANIFTNPDLSDASQPVAILPGRFEARLNVVTNVTGFDPSRLLQWIVAWTGLSAAWFIADGDEKEAAIDLTINALAHRCLAT